jgi:pilus assembly protein CpaB
MTRRRRAAALLGLALLLGVLAASDVAGREAALRRRLGPAVPVVVARVPLTAGTSLGRAALAVRQVPARYAPASAIGDPSEVVGRRAAVAVAQGSDLDPAMLRVPGEEVTTTTTAALRKGERALDVVAVADLDTVAPGTRVDVLVTAESRAGDTGATRMVLRDAEVLAARPAPDDGQAAASGLPRVLASLRVATDQAVALTAATSAAREVRLLPRPPG